MSSCLNRSMWKTCPRMDEVAGIEFLCYEKSFERLLDTF